MGGGVGLRVSGLGLRAPSLGFRARRGDGAIMCLIGCHQHGVSHVPPERKLLDWVQDTALVQASAGPYPMRYPTESLKRVCIYIYIYINMYTCIGGSRVPHSLVLF